MVADLEEIATALHQLCDAYLEERAKVAEIEINPMFVYADHIVAVDALVHMVAS